MYNISNSSNTDRPNQALSKLVREPSPTLYSVSLAVLDIIRVQDLDFLPIFLCVCVFVNGVPSAAIIVQRATQRARHWPSYQQTARHYNERQSHGISGHIWAQAIPGYPNLEQRAGRGS